MMTDEVVGDYRVLGLLGAGGMGAVYKVEHLITRRVEAMKVLSTGIGCAPADLRRFEREIQVQARLHHPNIAALYSAVRHGDSLALIMEYVEGETLQQALTRGRLSLNTAVQIASQLLDALDYAHRNGVVHGDVSPANIVVTPSGAVKLTDFGLAREGARGETSSAGVPLGTAWYMSPEQVAGAGELDPRSDIYAAGAVLHEMLTGRKLFDAEGSFAVMRAHMETAPAPPSAYNPSVPAVLDEAIERALAKAPADRFQTAAEFGAAIVARPSAATTRRSPFVPRRYRTPRRLIGSAAAAAAAGVLFGAAIVRSRAPLLIVAARPPIAQRVEPVPPAPLEQIAPVPAAPAEPVPEETPMPAPSTRRIAKPARPAILAAKPAAPAPGPVRLDPAPAPVLPPAPADLAPLPEITHPAAVDAPAIPPAAPEEPKTKSGNRVVKALGKLNPFRRAPKEQSAAPAAKQP
jgi:eukaryotic-like serine/threonine-protein kinase